MLRRITADDADALFELDLDPELTYNINGGQPTPRDEVQKDFIPYFLEFYNKYAGFGFWAAIEKESDAFPGWFHIRPREDRPAGEIELGYRRTMPPGARATLPKAPAPLSTKGFSNLASSMSLLQLSQQTSDHVAYSRSADLPSLKPTKSIGHSRLKASSRASSSMR